MSSVAAGSDLFIAPEGAMQFEFIKGKLPRVNPLPGAINYRPDFLWVGLPESSRRSCNCKICYPVYHEDFPEDRRLVAEEVLRRNGLSRSFVCNCMGRIIE